MDTQSSRQYNDRFENRHGMKALKGSLLFGSGLISLKLKKGHLNRLRVWEGVSVAGRTYNGAVIVIPNAVKSSNVEGC